jgi:Zn-dependent M28 family amino/carboxypeptidase
LCWALTAAALAAVLGFPLLHGAGPWWLAGGAVVLLAGLFFNFTGNRCPGALDNGSAVGTLLELARSWFPEPGVPVEVVWVATGSEEVDLDGARHLLRAHAGWWQDLPTLVINLESVGAGTVTYLAGEPTTLRLAEGIADELAIEHARLSVLGAGMDHEPFAARGLPSVSILGDVVRNSFALHSRRDNLGLIEPTALQRAGRLASHLAWRWARLHQTAIAVPAGDLSAEPVVGGSVLPASASVG